MTKQGSQGEVEVLFELIRGGDLSKVIEFLRRSRDLVLTALDSKKRTALHVAAEIGSSQLVDMFLNKGLSVHSWDKLLWIPLHWAALNGHEVALEILVKAGSEIYTKDSLGRTAFHYAACSGAEDAGANALTIMASWDPEIVHITDNHQWTALHYAIFNANAWRVDIVRRLIELGSDVNAIDEERKSALHYASENGKSKVIPILV